MRDGRPTMGFWEALWAVAAGLLVAGMLGLEAPAFLILAVVVAYFALGALYWKVRLNRLRRRPPRRRAGPAA